MSKLRKAKAPMKRIQGRLSIYYTVERRNFMKVLCPTCGGKGTINDPVPQGSMAYCGPNGESWPQIICQTCGGTGWVEEISSPSRKVSE